MLLGEKILWWKSGSRDQIGGHCRSESQTWTIMEVEKKWMDLTFI